MVFGLTLIVIVLATLHSSIWKHPSAFENRDYIEAEKNAGPSVGPLQQPDLPLLYTSLARSPSLSG